jgi:hypothetical protein
MRQASDYKADKRAAAARRSLTKSSYFLAIFGIAHQGGYFGQNCLLYEIEERELLCTKPGGAGDAKKTL